MTRVLVTGAAGFIGSHLADQLIERGHRVRALVREHCRPLPSERVFLAEAAALAQESALTGWHIASGPFWLAIEGRKV